MPRGGMSSNVRGVNTPYRGVDETLEARGKRGGKGQWKKE